MTKTVTTEWGDKPTRREPNPGEIWRWHGQNYLAVSASSDKNETGVTFIGLRSGFTALPFVSSREASEMAFVASGSSITFTPEGAA